MASRVLPSVVWEGPLYTNHSYAAVNRELCCELLRAGLVDLRLVSPGPQAGQTPAERRFARWVASDPRYAALAPRVGIRRRPPAQVHVRHTWPPRFTPPRAGRWVVIQPWEYGSLPVAWVGPMNRCVDEVWVPSRHVRNGYVGSGVRTDKVVVVPNGVDPARFSPEAPPLDLATRKRFRFLYVGGTIARKGADIALAAYVRAFRRSDDVCLVIKDVGTDSFYAGQGLRAQISARQAAADCPEILYLERDLPPRDMPRLYAACSCLTLPYRAEGFGLPIAEAMACGLPVIVPDGGACLDFCDSTVAVLVPAHEAIVPEPRLGELILVGPPRWLEVDVDDLARVMRRCAGAPDWAQRLGQRASRRVRRELTWERAAALVAERLVALAASR